MNNQNGYGPLLHLLGAMLGGGRPDAPVSPQNPSSPSLSASGGIFTRDETGCTWRREEKLELLEAFCREGYVTAKKYGHFLIGTGPSGSFIGIPGRFLLEEQPAAGVTGFTLWQPLAGGEELYDTLENLSGDNAAEVYGYWIARLDPETLKISEF